MENPVYPVKFVGNPSLSVTVSQYMISLRRQKVMLSAMDEPTLKELWVFNCAAERNEHVRISRKRKAEHPEDWGGFLIQMMLYLLYLVSFLCLLRFDEALQITWHDVSFQVKDPLLKGHWIDATPKIFNQGIFKGSDFHVRLMLPFRKMHQHGGIAPFHLYADIHKPWMCPIRTFAIWWLLTSQNNEHLDGYVFRKKVGSDGSSESFLECFRNNLLDIGVDPRPTIFKYLLSWTDSPFVEREDYFNPNCPRHNPCPTCGRTCACA
ncbi:hypothetical protein F4604DRAFT_1878459 [Suillus subluteus]|nr:hypothetical protein F4604DRAFT_1878459 [Suillus subluteus]